MRRTLIVGDSQAGGPAGRIAEQALRAAGRDVLRLAETGRGPVSWSSGSLWTQYVQALSDHRPTDVILIFGSNDYGARLAPALDQLKGWAEERFGARVWYSGPPHYPDPERERIGASIRNDASGVFGARYIDAWPLTPVSAGRAADGVHLTESAARPWGEAIARVVHASVEPGGERPAPTRPREAPDRVAWPWLVGAGLAGLALALVLRQQREATGAAQARRRALRARLPRRRAS